MPRDDPRHVLISTNRRDRGLFDVERLDLDTGEVVRIAENPGDIMSWCTDREGRLRAAYAQTPTGDWRVLVRDDEHEPFRLLAEFANEDSGAPYAFSADGRELYVGSARDSDLVRLVAVDVATGGERVLDADDEADLGAPIISDRTGALLGAVYRRDRDRDACVRRNVRPGLGARPADPSRRPDDRELRRRRGPLDPRVRRRPRPRGDVPVRPRVRRRRACSSGHGPGSTRRRSPSAGPSGSARATG